MKTDTHARIRVASPEDMLALMPYLLGFRPTESLVAILLSGSRIVLTARVDVPPARHLETALGQLSTQLQEVARRHDVDRVVIGVFSEDWLHAETVLRRVAFEPSLPVILALHCDRDRYRILEDDGQMSSDHEFDPLGSVAVAEAVLAGLGPLADRSAVAERIAPAPEDVISRLTLAAEEVDLPDDRASRAALIRRTVQHCLDHQPTDVDRATLALLTLDIEVRDVAWLLMDQQSASEHLDLWLSVARCAPEVLSAAPVSLAGMAAWLSGDGALAWCCVDRVAQEHPRYRLAGLLHDLLDQAVHPDTWSEMLPGMVEGREGA